jgi:hypothetical protein
MPASELKKPSVPRIVRSSRVVAANRRLWRAGTAIADHRAMPQWRLRLVQVKCRRCETEASIPLEYVRRPPQTPIWKLEAALKCRSCRTSRYSPPVHMIKLTEAREIVPYVWVHPDDQR